MPESRRLTLLTAPRSSYRHPSVSCSLKGGEPPICAVQMLGSSLPVSQGWDKTFLHTVSTRSCRLTFHDHPLSPSDIFAPSPSGKPTLHLRASQCLSSNTIAV